MKKCQVYTGLLYRVGLVPVRLTFTGILHGQLGDDGSSLEWGDTETYFLSYRNLDKAAVICPRSLVKWQQLPEGNGPWKGSLLRNKSAITK